VFESPSTRSCIQANRTERCLLSLFFSRFHTTSQCQPHGHAVLLALVLLLCMLFSSVRGNSECFRTLYHLDAAPAFVHHTVIAAYLGCNVPSIEPVHVGSLRLPLTARQCIPMQVDARSRCKTKARPGLSKRGDFTISFPRSQDFGRLPALAWHKDEAFGLARRRVRSHSFLTSLTHACMLPIILDSFQFDR
jgi:hypothetical protein